MPFDGSGNYTLPAGYLATANTPALVSQHNTPLEDIAAALSDTIKKNGATAMAAALTLSGNATLDLHAVPRQQLDSEIGVRLAAAGVKLPVLVATTANITLSGEQTIDGVLTSASRVLVKNQSTASQNGIYVSGAGSWARATDMDAWSEVPSSLVVVQQGSTLADTLWLCTSNTGGTLGTTAIAWQQASGAGAFQALDALLTSIAALSVFSGSLIYATGTDAVTQLSIGSSGQILTVSGGVPAWTTGVVTAASQAQQEARTAVDVNVTPGRQHFHPGHPKAWVAFQSRVTNGACTILASYGVSGVSRSAAGVYDVTFSTAFSSTSFCAMGTLESASRAFCLLTARSTTSCQFTHVDNSGAFTDGFDRIHATFFGDHA